MCVKSTYSRGGRGKPYPPAIREHAIDLLEDDGLNAYEVAERLGMTHVTVYVWHRQYQAAGREIDRKLGLCTT